MRRLGRRLGAVLALAAVTALGGIGVSAPAAASPNEVTVIVPPASTPAPGEDGVIRNAQLRWGLSVEAGSRAPAPGTCNFLSAGVAGDTGGSRTWTASDGLYRAHDGAVRIEKPNARGIWQLASFADRCTDPQGQPLTSGSATRASGNQVVIDGGEGTSTAGETRIQWRGSFTVAFYSGMTYWSVTDPLLSVDASGNGRLTGTASGYGADMNDMTTWSPIAPRSIVLAEIRRVNRDDGAGFAVVPEYLGVTVDTVETPQVRSGTVWGSFPQSFVDFQQLTGQSSYWYSSGGLADQRKPATTLYVSYDAAAPVPVPAPPTTGAASSASADDGLSNPVRVPPAVGAAAGVPAVPVGATLPVSATTAVTTLPAAAALVPEALTALSPLVAPLLGAAAALGLSIIAVLSLMNALPWQRRPGV